MKESPLLGNFQLSFTPFVALDKAFATFDKKAFTTLSARKKFEAVNLTLLTLIQDEKEPCYLLAQVIDYIAKINQKKLLLESYHMLQFEFWLNHYSQLTLEENRHIRCKIVGKNINRDEYQLFFPIGMNKILAGSHFVAAHLSPDVDTTIASFWGWVDAFGAKVGSGLHHWALPAAISDSQIAMLFQTVFTKDVLDVLARQTPTLSLTALDLVCSKDVVRLNINSHLTHIHAGKLIVAVDDKGHFKGDWRASDAEQVRQVINAFYGLIRWLEHTIYYSLISAYAKEKVTKKDIQTTIKALFNTKLEQSDAANEYSDIQKNQVSTFLKSVLKIPKGLNATYQELSAALNVDFEVETAGLFAKDGTLQEDRPNLFKHLETHFRQIAAASSSCRQTLERFSILLAIKDQVLGIPSQFITLKSDVEEIRTKINNLEYLTVAIPEEDGNWFPVGVVYANDIKRKPLGTVSLRDFSSENETKMASYLEVVSIIDHHKSDIKTSSASTIIVGDAQSANTIVAEQVLSLNKRYSLLGMSPQAIISQKKTLQTSVTTLSDLRALQDLVELAINAEKTHELHYIHPMREYSEYLFFLHAILDDTDLLTKVSNRDLEVIRVLLNRMKSLSCAQNKEIISFDGIARDAHFTESASRRILQNDDMYSIYQKIYAHKEKEVETNLAACIKGKASTIFTDTKEQNGCARIGQTKLFSTNFSSFTKHSHTLQTLWLNQAQKIYENTPQIDLHMQMITTIATADEVHQGKTGKWKHHDELWIWVPPVQAALEHLVNFLNAFSASELVQQNDMQVEFLGDNFWDLELVFSQNFPKAIKCIQNNTGLPIAQLRYKAGLINSRKAFITPYLPRLIS